MFCGLLDYYDDWNNIDSRLADHHKHLSGAAAAFGHDLVHQATYIHEILRRLPSVEQLQAEDVVTVASMTEAFLVSLRSAYDAIAAAIGYVACEKTGQAPRDSLRSLADWASPHPTRARAAVRELLGAIPGEFWELRKLRDLIVHTGASVNIHTDGRQFNLWLYGVNGWITREPLMPLLARQQAALLQFGNAAASVVGQQIELPADRLRSRMVEGVFISSLHRLQVIQTDYAAPSP